MARRLRLLGTLELQNEPPILLCAYSQKNKDARHEASLRRRLLDLLDGPFHPLSTAMEESTRCRLISVDELLALWGCHRITVLRLIKRGQLHPIGPPDEMYFDRAEVDGIRNRRIAVYPHLTLARRPARPS